MSVKRTNSRLEFEVAQGKDPKTGRIIGVDLGGTKARAVLSDGSGTFLARAQLPTEADLGLEHVLNNIETVVRAVMELADFSSLIGMGIGAPGPLNPETGIVYSPPNLPGWNYVPLRDIMEERIGLPVYLGNDANLAALGEYTFGAGKDYRFLVYITVSTGVGGGIIEDGRILMGARGAAGELGHMSIDLNGPRCNCGNIGCLEILTSGTAIRRRAIEMLDAGRPSLLAEMSGSDPEKITAELVARAALQGDEAALELLEQTGVYLGVGVTNILHIFNPEIVVIGGGVSRIGELIFEPLQRVVEERAMPAFREQVKIVPTDLGDDIGLYGAVALVLQNFDVAKKHKQELKKF
ncbi:MAG TPA: ROK family protein [Chloroflexia bacterium]|nr:ROK family protein [Chloroflexia bacterium]